ncbi:MAG: 16S rRNA (cytidine(1402)-2'-O)-methyltransferase [Oligoflexia bacterium]|nr:16S rRNA (cytidine(1402)-2'-O)-methyltransferase [Oligoflexia bacterium]MBF0366813.1 16S rRNA (cytidine(1402)-2'-O)-methyltransferase [Oligoflexia bacterium]
MTSVGKLNLLSVPIGHLGDITIRAKEVLTSATLFAVEDSRVFKKLLMGLGISMEGKKIYSFHDHTPEKSISLFIDYLKRGEDLYLVSDAGSPVISDPAYPLIRRVLDSGFEIKTVPGVSSLITALELSGLPPFPMHFFGFFPRTKEKRKQVAKMLQEVSGTSIFFESPQRVRETMDELYDQLRVDGVKTKFVIARELTKKFESVYRFSGEEGEWNRVKDEIVYKGEFVVLIHRDNEGIGAVFEQNSGVVREELTQIALRILQEGGKPKLIAELLSSILRRDKKEIYDLMVSLSKKA